ncbi:MAG: hypothetical protein H7323_06485 [Frankiales bacterium]|nr:hypothetical protein [Frankiales bacterium]
MRALAEQPPGHGRHDQHLQVAQDRRQARADRLDGVMPEHQVDGEERAGGGGQLAGASRQRPEAAVLAARQQREQRQREQAAEQRCCRRRDIGQAYQRSGPGDAQRAQQRDEHRASADPFHDRSSQG